MRMCLVNWNLTLMKLFIKQPIKKFSKASKVKSVFAILFIWVLSSAMLTTCFTCLLRSTYSWKTPKILVNSIEDVINNQDISVAGRKGLRELKSGLKPRIFRKLKERLIEYEIKMNINSNKVQPLRNIAKTEVISDVNEGKAILIVDSNLANQIQTLFPNCRLRQSKHKYKQRFAFSYVTRGHSYSERIYRMQV